MVNRISPYTNEVLAHAAGFFDGEGCISLSIDKKDNSISITTIVSNTNRDILEYFKRTFGGYINVTPHNDRPKWKPLHNWHLFTKDSIDFLRLIQPWIVIKREQIDLALFLDSIRNKDAGGRHSDDYIFVIWRIKEQMNWLNRRGRRAPSDIEPIKLVTGGGVWAEDHAVN